MSELLMPYYVITKKMNNKHVLKYNYLYGYSNKRKTWKGIMIRNVLTRRREYGTYLATAGRHRRRLKMQKRDESRSFQPALRPSSAVEEGAVLSPPC